jgi:hypothetical protein
MSSAGELVDADFVEVSVRGVEGPAWTLIGQASLPDDPLVTQAAAIAEMADGDDTTSGASCHLLALAHR